MSIKKSCCIAFCVFAAAFTGVAARGQNQEQPKKPDAKRPVLEFRGLIDGSEVIEITSKKATWQHLYRKYPGEPVTINGVQWDPRDDAELPNRGPTQFLDGAVDFTRAKLEVIEGRDIVAMTKTKDGITLYINDTPNGEGRYRLRVTFDAQAVKAKPPAKAGPVTLRVRATIDGSDILHITQGEARWEHKGWLWPAQVALNAVPWDPKNQETLPNKGMTEFLPETVDFSTAKSTLVLGRDLAVVVPHASGLTIYFADNPNGPSDYELLITLGQKAGGK